MPFSNPSEVDARQTTIQQPQTTLQGRYVLRRCMADSALGKLHWAQDLQKNQANGEQANLFIFLINPMLSQQLGFEGVFKQVLATYQRPAPAMPIVIDNGTHNDGTRWYAIQNTNGMLLSERLQELDERGMPLPDALQLLEQITQATAQFRPDGVFGYLEPSTLLLSHEGIKLMSAPIVSALRLLQTGRHDITLPTLHSGYISPEVLLGHLPIASDDTFSIACLTYYLLKGEMPYAKYSTLEAAVRNVFPTSTRKLRQEAWNVLQQGLSLQRAPRPATPTAFLRTLQRKQHNRLLVPVAATAAVSTLALAGYFVISSWNKPEPVPATALAPLTEPSSPTTVASAPTLVNEPSTSPTTPDTSTNSSNTNTNAASVNTTPVPTPTTTTTNPEIQTLLQQANDAIHRGNILSQDDKPAALDYLRKVYQQDPSNNEAKTLLAQLVDDQQAEAETLLSSGQVDTADNLLNRTDNLITEFTLHDSLKRQVALESQVEQAKRNPNTEPAIATAVGAGAATATTTTNAVTANTTAITPLNSNLDPSDWAGQAKAAQEQALNYLKKGKTVEARPHLDASQALIVQHNLEKLVEEQLALEQRFRETRDNMGIFPADTNKPSTAEKKPESSTKRETAASTRSTSGDTADAKPRNNESQKEKTASRETNTRPPQTERNNTPRSNPAVTQQISARSATHPPVEYVAPPVQARPAPPRPPAQPTPVRPQPAPPPPVAARPANQGNGNVPDLMEVPLNMITNQRQ